ncbi:MAG: Ig-like domain-containing protein [Gammaproteobacteria bacterium]
MLPAVLLALHWSSTPHAGILTPSLQANLKAHAPADEIAVIVSLSDKINVGSRVRRDRRRDPGLVRDLKAKADLTQPSLRTFLKDQGAKRIRPLWVTNGIAAIVRADVIPRLASQPGVAIVQLDQRLLAPAKTSGDSAPPEWNLGAVHADELWALGYSGHGVVVANMDTGVDPYHPDLNGKWRGGNNSWFDPHGQHSTPYDGDGHGTQTMGILVGGAAGGNAIGVAPDARWIAAKIFNDAGQAQLSDIHLAFQWLLDPDGNPNTQDAPDVVNASWGLDGSLGTCALEFSSDIQTLKAAGIGVVFAAGNSGPNNLTSGSPANNPGAFATGAVDDTLVIADFSSRGPSACDGGLFPHLSAPGVNIRTADLSFGGFPLYTTLSGTSYAAPHTAGAMALLLGAYPAIGIAALESALTRSAQDLGQPGSDTDYGYGLVDVSAAYRLLLTPTGGSPPAITSSPVTIATQGVLYNYTVTATDPDGGAPTYSLDTAPPGMSIAAGNGLIGWTPNASQVGNHPVTVRAQDVGGLFATQSFTVTVANVNDAPVALNDSYNVSAGARLNVAAPGVLGNDGDMDGDALTARMVAAPIKGTLTLNANGAFSYTPKPGYSGTDSFTYQAHDGALHSITATVTLTVQRNLRPVAVNDHVTARTYISKVIAVLANDRDPDGSLNVGTVIITTAPSDGTVQVNANGTVSYKSRRNFKGIDRFRYTVKDKLGATSNVANVHIKVVK